MLELADKLQGEERTPFTNVFLQVPGPAATRKRPPNLQACCAGVLC